MLSACPGAGDPERRDIAAIGVVVDPAHPPIVAAWPYAAFGAAVTLTSCVAKRCKSLGAGWVRPGLGVVAGLHVDVTGDAFHVRHLRHEIERATVAFLP
jgi:hypothetical protein